jgi:hypothetical protein
MNHQSFHPTFHYGSPLLNLVPVCNVLAIDHLVKESEVLTGQPGRAFVIAGADRLAYQVRLHPNGYEVERLDSEGHRLSQDYVPAKSLAEHSLGGALRCGQLYTAPLV